MRNEMTVLANLDMSSVSIKAYTGAGGTYTSTSYPANQMPERSFINSYTNTGKTTLKNVILPNTTTSIGAMAFGSCSGLTNVTIPNSVTSIGNEAFQNCTELTNIALPNSITSIGNSTFWACRKITSITIPNSVTLLDGYAFAYCSGLKTIYCSSNTPPLIRSYCFIGVTTITSVYVPAAAVSTYKTAVGWSDLFFSVIFADNTATNYGITIQVGTGGTVKENNVALNDGSILSVTPNTTKTFSFTPITGYEISTLTYNGTDVKSQIINNQYTTSAVNANATLSVTFQKIKYRLSLKDASTGTMNLLCDYGVTPSFDFTPTTGWKVNTVLYNSTDVTSSLVNGVYTVPTITANALLNVSFVSIATGASEIINNRVKVYGTNTEIIVDGTSEGETVTLYTVNGRQIQTVMSKGERLNLPVDRDAVYLVKTGEKTFKVIL